MRTGLRVRCTMLAAAAPLRVRGVCRCSCPPCSVHLHARVLVAEHCPGPSCQGGYSVSWSSVCTRASRMRMMHSTRRTDRAVPWALQGQPSWRGASTGVHGAEPQCLHAVWMPRWCANGVWGGRRRDWVRGHLEEDRTRQSMVVPSAQGTTPPSSRPTRQSHPRDGAGGGGAHTHCGEDWDGTAGTHG